jgi:hypothetical protein
MSFSSGGDAGTDCGSTPTQHVSEAGTIFCGFGEGDAGDQYCPIGQECCLGGAISGGFAPDGCYQYGSVCTNGGGDAGSKNEQPLQIECNQISDCHANGNTGATACCLQGNAECAGGYTCGSTTGTCPYPKYSDGTGIACEGTGGGTTATACAAGEIQVCSSQADCASGTCTFGKWKIVELGFCL